MKGEISSVSRLPRHSHPGASFQSSAHRYKNILQPYQREKIGAHPHRQENLGSQVLPCLASSSHSTAAFWASFRALAGVSSSGGYQVVHLKTCLPSASRPTQALNLKDTIFFPLIFSWMYAILTVLSTAKRVEVDLIC